MKKTLTSMAVAAAVAWAGSANATEVLVNGNFESGSFSGWSVANSGSGSWNIDTPGTTTPISGQATAGNALGGSFYAVTDQGGPGAHALIQGFTIAPGASSVILKFQMFMNDQSGSAPIINPAGLTESAGPNQHTRVDILSSSATAFDTGAGVLGNLFIGDDAGANPNPFTDYLFDITSLVGGGGTFALRFAEVDNQLFYNVGVDNVSIDATNGVPEPTSLALFGLALAGIGLGRRRQSVVRAA